MAKSPTKIFLDSNVILSGIISDKGSPRIILDLLSLHLPFFRGATGQYNLTERERNLRKKLPAALKIYKDCLKKLDLEIVPMPDSLELDKCPVAIAPKEVPVLVSALLCQADYLVTGDQKDFGKIKGIATLPLRIVSPAEAVRIMGSIAQGEPG